MPATCRARRGPDPGTGDKILDMGGRSHAYANAAAFQGLRGQSCPSFNHSSLFKQTPPLTIRNAEILIQDKWLLTASAAQHVARPTLFGSPALPLDTKAARKDDLHRTRACPKQRCLLTESL